MQERTPYQSKIIKRYYDHRGDIMRQKLAELVTELYLADGKKRERVWKRIEAALTNLGIAPERIEHLVASNNPSLLAQFVEKELPS